MASSAQPPTRSAAASVSDDSHPRVMAPSNSNPGFMVQHPPPFSYNISQTGGAGFSHNQKFQPNPDTSTSASQASALSPASTNTLSSAPNVAGISAPNISTNPSLLGLPGLAGMPPGLMSSSPATLPSVPVNSALSSVQRPIMPAGSHASNPVLHQNYHSYPPMAPSPQGLWFQPPQMGGMVPRAPFLPYSATYPGPFPLPAQGISAAAPVGIAGVHPPTSSASGHHLTGTPGLQKELPPGIDNKNHILEPCIKDNTASNDDAWTAHKTDTGVVYYYNAVSGVSTYEKPPGFKSEPQKVPVQPTPVSMENLAGTDWALVTTNDGKKYYYNNRTKLSSWQIPPEVTELKKKREVELKEEQEMSVPNSNAMNDKGSIPTSLSAPAISTGGRDATALRASSALGTSSALVLIKKKLQESGVPVASSADPISRGLTTPESNGSRALEASAKVLQSENNSKEKLKDANGDVNASDSTSDSEEEDNGPTKEECIIKFKEMLKERGIAPFSKWEKELPKIVFDPRFQAIPSHSARRSLFEHYVKTRAEEERKEKRAALKAAIEGFKQLLEEASEDIDHNTDYQSFRKKWGNDPRFGVVDRKEREHLLNERVIPLKRAAEERAQAERAAAADSFKSMLRDKGDITVNTRWSKVKDSLRNDPRYKSVRHEEREALFNEYLSELKAAAEEAEQEAKVKKEEQDKLKERERELRKRKEREEQEMERVREKIRRKEAVASFQALLVETIKDPQASWTESKPRLEKDPQGRGTNLNLDPLDAEKLFREHVKMLHERCTHEFKALLAEVINAEAASQRTEDGKTVLDSWSTAKRILKPDPRYNKMPRKDREILWRRHAEDVLRKQKVALEEKEDKPLDPKSRSSTDSGRYLSGSKRSHDRR